MNAVSTDLSFESVALPATGTALQDETISLVDAALLMHVGGGSLVNFY